MMTAVRAKMASQLECHLFLSPCRYCAVVNLATADTVRLSLPLAKAAFPPAAAAAGAAAHYRLSMQVRSTPPGVMVEIAAAGFKILSAVKSVEAAAGWTALTAVLAWGANPMGSFIYICIPRYGDHDVGSQRSAASRWARQLEHPSCSASAELQGPTRPVHCTSAQIPTAAAQLSNQTPAAVADGADDDDENFNRSSF